MSPRWFPLTFLSAIVLICLAATIPTMDQTEKKRYSILKSSKLFLTGTTNVNTFKCDCRDRFATQNLHVENRGSHARFSNTSLRMTTKKFDCKNGKMDRDMHKALMADAYPYIEMELVETWFNPKQLKNGDAEDWFDVKAKVKLTITCVTKEQTINAKYKALSKNKFILRGSKSLKMTDYGIDPPEALFGMIKVDDLITFNFNLDIAVEDLAQ